MLLYTLASEFRDRYQDMVILLRGHPVFIKAVSPREGEKNPKFSYVRLPWDVEHGGETKAEELSCLDPGFFDTPLTLGYINRPGVGAAYLSRMPVRRSKQGLGADNVRSTDGSSFWSLIRSPGFVDMMAGKYPTFTEALEIVSKKQQGSRIAFNRTFAVDKDDLERYTLYYRGLPIGSGYTPESMRFPDRFKYLREAVNDVGIRFV